MEQRRVAENGVIDFSLEKGAWESQEQRIFLVAAARDGDAAEDRSPGHNDHTFRLCRSCAK